MIGGIVLDSAGRVYVAEIQDARIVVFSPVGELLTSLQQQGAGPGDLRFPCCLHVDDAGRLWVYDLGNRRYTVFSPGADGTLRFKFSIPSGDAGYFTTDQLRRYGTNGVFHLTTVQSGTRIGALVIAALDSAGDWLLADTLQPSRGEQIELLVETGNSTAKYTTAVPFGARDLFALGPSGLYARAMGADYRVVIRTVDGDSITTISLGAPPIRVSPRETDSAKAALDKWVISVGAKRSDLEVTVPTTKPAIQSLGFDQDGRLWVERSVTDGSPAIADLFDHAGKLLATREWPSNVRLVSWASRGDTAFGVQTTSEGEPVIVRMIFDH